MSAARSGKEKPPKNPCMGCESRHPTCHADCPEYLSFWQWNREQDTLRLMEANCDQMKIKGIVKARQMARQMKGRIT